MYQSTRESIIDILLEDSDNKRKLFDILEDDPFARMVFQEEKIHLLIESYLDGKLTEKKKSQFENLLISNRSISKEFNLRRKVNDAIRDTDLVQALEKAYIDSETSESIKLVTSNTSKERRKLTPVIKWVAAAASILILISLGVYSTFNNQTIETSLYKAYYQPIDITETKQYVVNTSSLSIAKKKYYNSEYQDALISFKNLPGSLNIETERNFYMALSMMELGYYKEAIEKFNSVINNDEFECVKHAYWYLGLCYLRIGENQKAINIFDYIVKADGYNSQRAIKILKKLS